MGEINSIVSAALVESARFATLALVKQTPPTYAYYLAVLDAYCIVISWVAVMRYVYKVAPPDLVSTTTALVHVIAYLISKHSNFPPNRTH